MNLSIGEKVWLRLNRLCDRPKLLSLVKIWSFDDTPLEDLLETAWLLKNYSRVGITRYEAAENLQRIAARITREAGV